LQQVGLTEVRIILESTFVINGKMRKFSKNLVIQILQACKQTIFSSDAVSPALTFYSFRQY